MIEPMKDGLSVFFPTYNESANIKNTVEKAVAVLKKSFKTWEIIIIDDGSTDATGKITDDLAATDKRIRVIHHSHNQGYGMALKTGMYNSIYPWITFTDSDGQFDFSEIRDFIDKRDQTGADLIIGYYRHRQVSFFRKLNTFLWQSVVFLLFGLHVRDIDCAFKLFSHKVIDKIPKLESERGAFISSEFLIKSQKAGFKIVEIPVSHYPRRAGQGTGAQLNVIIKSFTDLFRLWFKLR